LCSSDNSADAEGRLSDELATRNFHDVIREIFTVRLCSNKALVDAWRNKAMTQ